MGQIADFEKMVERAMERVRRGCKKSAPCPDCPQNCPHSGPDHIGGHLSTDTPLKSNAIEFLTPSSEAPAPSIGLGIDVNPDKRPA